MVTRAQAKYFAERGPNVEEMDLARLQRAAIAAQEAFGAATLLEAQEIIGAAVPSLVTSMTLSSDFDSPTGGAPQTTATRTLTVAAGNPGRLIVTLTQTGTAGTPTYSLNAGPNTSVSDGDEISVADTDTLSFRVPVGIGTTTFQLVDATTGANVGLPFTITTT